MRIKMTFVLTGLCLFAFLWGCGSSLSETPPRPAAADFELSALTGERLTLEGLKGKVVILDFFATHCPPCRKEIPHFNSLYAEYKQRGLVVIGVSTRAIEAAEAGSFGIDYPVAVATQKILNEYGPIQFIPTTYVIGPEGFVYKKYIGYRPEDTFRRDIIFLLNEN